MAVRAGGRGHRHRRRDPRAEAAGLGLIDDYGLRIHPALGGIPCFPRDDRRVDPEVLNSGSFGCGVAWLRYRLAR